ncbi:extended synaptotagmin-2-A isoform X7 [Syngnathus scovelli]|uniref:extended synaptotagmin-2-A isoform X7 n=1 Tax=Syngnathus scovelli TaxID=161590 RepID=UPI0021109629|nr:extended synaptotagmin-2-A isoform X7 [Syngnathus scovelli]
MSRDSMTAVRGAHGGSTSSSGSSSTAAAAAAAPKENGYAAPKPAPPGARFHRPSAPADDSPVTATGELTQTWVQFAKTFVLIFPIYALGYYEFSFSWMLIGLVVYFWWRRNAFGKRSRLSRALAFLEREERSLATALSTSDLPPWVHFPDVERVEWLNKVKEAGRPAAAGAGRLSALLAGRKCRRTTVKQMWPYICKYAEKLFRDTVEPAVKESNAHLSTFRFSRIDMGDKPLRVNGVKVYSENVDRRQIVMDLQISFVGNTEIDVDIKRYYCKAGIKSIQIHGVLRVLMEPLLGDVPLVGALSLFFLKKPLLDINWTGLTNVLDIPGLTGLSDSLIQDIISSYVVSPNRITIPLVGDVELAQLRFPMPKSAKKSSSEPSPYVQLTVGHKTQESKIRYKTKEPLWEDSFSFLVHNPRRQELEVEVKDEKSKCTLGNLSVPLSGLLAEEDMTLTQCFPLSNSGPSSSIRFKMALRILSLEKQVSSDQPSSVRVRKSSVPQAAASTRASASYSPPPGSPSRAGPPPAHASSLTLHHRDGEPYGAIPPAPPRSVSSLCVGISASQKHLAHNESTPSLASDISLPFAALELQQRLGRLHNGSTSSQFLLGEVHLTIRHSAQRNKLIVVVHACRNLMAFSKDTSDPFIRLYLLPDKSRTGRRKTGTVKRSLNPVYDQTFEFSVSVVELHRRTLDVAVKNGGNILSKHKGLLGKVLVHLSGEDIAKGWTQWHELSEDGLPSQRNIEETFTL